MIIVAMTDIHDDVTRLGAIAEDLKAADLVLLTGDLTNFGGGEDAARVVKAVRRHNTRVLAVPGNCDPRAVDTYLTREGINLHRRSVVVDGVAFVGVGGSLPCPGRTPNEYSEEEMAAILAEGFDRVHPSDPLVLVTHQPPRGTVADRLPTGIHVGSASVRAFVERVQPVLCLTGHIHEGRGLDTIGRTPVVNPGPFWMGGYTYARISRTGAEVEIRPRQALAADR
jgi:uncharacterized protein